MKQVLEIKETLHQSYRVKEEGQTVDPILFMRELRQALPRDSTVFTDTGQHATHVSFPPLFPAFGPRTVIDPGG
ncbi:hypothetical protein FDZ71_12820 [bacterium]|nr:MAG: hypothetical protein FDZ71_12820 [bacterium]